jgi:hypothetical protein
MPVFAGFVATQLLAGVVGTGVAYSETERAPDPCRPPAIRMESANIAALPGPNSPACREARKLRAEEQQKKAEKVEKTP